MQGACTLQALPSPAGFVIPQLPVPDHFASINAGRPRDVRNEPLDLEPALAALPRVNRDTKRDRLVPASKETVTTLAPSRPERARPEGSDIPAEAWLDAEDVEPFGLEAEFAGTLARDLDPVPPSGSILQISRLIFTDSRSDLPPLNFAHAALSPVERLQLAALPRVQVEDHPSAARLRQPDTASIGLHELDPIERLDDQRLVARRADVGHLLGVARRPQQ